MRISSNPPAFVQKMCIDLEESNMYCRILDILNPFGHCLLNPVIFVRGSNEYI